MIMIAFCVVACSDKDIKADKTEQSSDWKEFYNACIDNTKESALEADITKEICSCAASKLESMMTFKEYKLFEERANKIKESGQPPSQTLSLIHI